MSKNALGELKLSPLKENGKFVFVVSEIRMNGKLNKGDSIKIFVDSYEQQNGRYLLKNSTVATSKIVVRGTPIQTEHPEGVTSVEELYEKACQMYRNQFYFGKVEM